MHCTQNQAKVTIMNSTSTIAEIATDDKLRKTTVKIQTVSHGT